MRHKTEPRTYMPRPSTPEWERYIDLTYADLQERLPDPRITRAFVDLHERGHYSFPRPRNRKGVR